MPFIPAPAKVLVTGASGFVATHVVKTLLERGYTVIGTVRSVEKGEYLVDLFQDYGNFTYVIVEDNEAPGAFDEAVKGVDAVQHTSSPFHLAADHPDELIGPAVKGTIGILESVQKNAPNVKRIVITSSAAAIVSTKTSPYVFTEADWNTESPGIVEREGRDAHVAHKYLCSKTLAERAAWDFVAKHKNEISWDLTTINPPLVFGPIIHQVKDVASLNTSISAFYHSVTDATADRAAVSAAIHNSVDVRDVAEAHVLALEKPAAGGERFITSVGPWTTQCFLDLLHKARIPNVPRGFPGSQEETLKKADINCGDKARRILGLRYTAPQDTVVDTLLSVRERFSL